MSSFKPITSKPNKNDPYIYLYNNQSNGGKSWCITGKPADNTCNVLCNCVGWACGRFNHIYNLITGYNGIKYPKFCCNAENFLEVAKNYGLTIGNTPKPGAIIVWQKGSTLSGSDGAGHVAVVEEVVSSNKIITSESGYNSFAFTTKVRTNDNGKWGVGSAYHFRGFIYNPAVDDNTVVEESTTTNIPSPVTEDHSKNQIRIKISSLRMRKDPSLNGTVIGYAKPGIYNFTNTSSKDGYTWYCIGNDVWVASSNNWCDIMKANSAKELSIGDKVRIEKNAPVYGSSTRFQSWVYNSDLYVRGITGKKITISIYKTGAITGSVDRKYIIV